MTYDYVIVGGGIVGVSTGWQLKRRYPEKSVLLIEKEAGFSRHQIRSQQRSDPCGGLLCSRQFEGRFL